MSAGSRSFVSSWRTDERIDLYDFAAARKSFPDTQPWVDYAKHWRKGHMWVVLSRADAVLVADPSIIAVWGRAHLLKPLSADNKLTPRVSGKFMTPLPPATSPILRNSRRSRLSQQTLEYMGQANFYDRYDNQVYLDVLRGGPKETRSMRATHYFHKTFADEVRFLYGRTLQ
jgi:hypothetical protein